MQQDAFRRVNEMRRRSQDYVSGNGGAASSQNKQTPPEQPQNTPQTDSKPPQNQTLMPFEQLISTFKLDEEKALIALVIYILAKNGADVKLLIALGYLLL